jgi:hypothetical protein
MIGTRKYALQDAALTSSLDFVIEKIHFSSIPALAGAEFIGRWIWRPYGTLGYEDAAHRYRQSIEFVDS